MPCTTKAPSRERCFRSASSRIRLISGFAALVISSVIAFLPAFRLSGPPLALRRSHRQYPAGGDRIELVRVADDVHGSDLICGNDEGDRRDRAAAGQHEDTRPAVDLGGLRSEERRAGK